MWIYLHYLHNIYTSIEKHRAAIVRILVPQPKYPLPRPNVKLYGDFVETFHSILFKSRLFYSPYFSLFVFDVVQVSWLNVTTFVSIGLQLDVSIWLDIKYLLLPSMLTKLNLNNSLFYCIVISNDQILYISIILHLRNLQKIKYFARSLASMFNIVDRKSAFHNPLFALAMSHSTFLSPPPLTDLVWR